MFYYRSYKLAKCVGKKFLATAQPALSTLGKVTQIEMMLSVLHSPRWLGQEGLGIIALRNHGDFGSTLCQCKDRFIVFLGIILELKKCLLIYMVAIKIMMILTDRLSELTAGLQGPPGRPGRGYRGPPGSAGPRGPVGKLTA